MKQLVRHKIIDKSILWDGMTLPRDVNQVLYDMLGKTLARGDKEPVRIRVGDEWFDVSLKNMNNSAEARVNDSLQLRWTPAGLGKKMRDLYITSTPILIDEQGKSIKGSRPQITEYVNIYAQDAHSIIFDCHMKLNNTDYELCKSNFNLLAAAKTKPFLILGGFSGTGKSMNVKELAYLTCPKGELQEGQEPGNYCLISVKPNWHDSTELLGYYSNIGKRYVVTDFIKFLVKAMRYPLVPFYVCMDEMNLAPVEEYFAEYLSVLESRKIVDGQVVSGSLVASDVFADSNALTALGLDTTKDKVIIEELQNHGLCLPQNLIVIGTVNMDDTTNSFSRKVIDRAMTFETKIEDIDPLRYFSLDNDALSYKSIACPERFINDQVRVLDVMKDGTPDFAIKEGAEDNNKEFTQFINDINKAMGNGKGYADKDTLGVSPFQVSYRVLNEAVLYYRSLCVLYPAAASLDKVFNDILMMKVLPRIEGEQDRAKKPLEGLQQYVSQRVGADEHRRAIYKDSIDKITYMLRPFQKGGDGFTTFWQ